MDLDEQRVRNRIFNMIQEARKDFHRNYGSYEFHADDLWLAALDLSLEIFKDTIMTRRRLPSKE